MIIPKFIYERMIEIEKEKSYEQGYKACIESLKWQIIIFPREFREELNKMLDEMLKSLYEFRPKRKRKL